MWYEETFQVPVTADKNRSRVEPSSMNTTAHNISSKSPKKIFRDPAMDEDQNSDEEEREGVDVDKHALKYIRARKDVKKLAAARKVDKT
jgi:hypothetical protein